MGSTIGRSGSVRREALGLVLAVLALDGLCIAIYLLAGLRHAADAMKVVFTAVWTLATLAVVIRGLSRIRSARVQRTSV